MHYANIILMHLFYKNKYKVGMFRSGFKMKKYICNLMMVVSTLTISTSISTAASTLDEIRNKTNHQLQRFDDGKLRCFPEIQSTAEAHIVYTYSGTDLVKEGLGGHPPKYFDVTVEKTDKPALLVLSAYEPIVWRLNLKSGANIAGIYLTGYYEQMATGLPDDIPLARNHFRLRSGTEKEDCIFEQKTVSDPKPPLKNKKEIREALQKLNKEMLPLQRKVLQYPAKISAYKEIKKELSKDAVHEKAVAVLDALLTQIQEELPELQKRMVEYQKKAVELYQSNQSNTNHARVQINRKYHKIDNAEQLENFEKFLAEKSTVKVASYQTWRGNRNKRSDISISSNAAKQFRELKEDGKKRLSELEPPKFDLVGLNKPALAPPSDYVAKGGIKYLINKGYVVDGASAYKYHCEKISAYAATKGTKRGKCRVRSRRGYTVVGPIVFPEGLCGGHSVTFYVPQGVPQPKGSPCHSQVIYLTEDEPCLGDRGECMMREARKRSSN